MTRTSVMQQCLSGAPLTSRRCSQRYLLKHTFFSTNHQICFPNLQHVQHALLKFSMTPKAFTPQSGTKTFYNWDVIAVEDTEPPVHPNPMISSHYIDPYYIYLLQELIPLVQTGGSTSQTGRSTSPLPPTMVLSTNSTKSPKPSQPCFHRPTLMQC